MKALSIMQPWAWAIIHAGKTVENRTWRTDYRGPLLIHASKRYDRYAVEPIIARMDPGLRTRFPDGIPPKLDQGGVVGVVDLVACIKKGSARFEDSMTRWLDGPYGFMLDRPQPIPFFPWPGKLGLFEFPDELLPRLGLTKVTTPKQHQGVGGGVD